MRPFSLSPCPASPATALATYVQSHEHSRQAKGAVPFHIVDFALATALPGTPLFSPIPLSSFAS